MSARTTIERELREGFNTGRRFTASLMAECAGIAVNSAKRALDTMTRAGKFTKSEEHGLVWYEPLSTIDPLPSSVPVLSILTTRQLVQLRNDIDAERCRRAPPGSVVAYQVRRPIPVGGALLHVELPDDNLITADWFPSVAVAKLALIEFAADLGRPIEGDGFSLDLTEPVGPTSKAWIEDRAATTTTTGEKR